MYCCDGVLIGSRGAATSKARSAFNGRCARSILQASTGAMGALDSASRRHSGSNRGSHRRGRTARSGRTHHSSDHLPIRSVTKGSGSDVRTTKSAHVHQASSVEIGFRAAIWTGLPMTGRPAGHRRAIQRSFAIRAMVTASP